MSVGRTTGGAPAELLIETLTPAGTPAVIAAGGHLRNWGDLPRFGGDRRLQNTVSSIVIGIRDSGQAVDFPHKQRGRRVRIIGHPVIGPSGAVHAVQLWVGDPDTDPPPRRRVAAFAWSSTSRLIEVSAELNDEWVQAGIAGRLTLTAPEAFRYVEHVDDAMTLIAKALDPVAEDHWAGCASIRTAQGLRTAQVAMRSMPTPQQQSWRGLVHDVTDVAPPAAPSLNSLTLSAMAARGTPTAVALMDVDQGRLIRWITDPIPGIQWKGIADDRDTPPSEDVERIFRSFTELKNGATQVHIPGVRLRRLDGGWTTVDARATLIPKTGGPLVVLAEMTPVDHGLAVEDAGDDFDH